MDILLVLLACFGLTTILVDSLILEKFRSFVSKIDFFKKLINCSMCTGFWVGIYFSVCLFILLTFQNIGLPWWIIRGIFYSLTIPFASSGVSWILERLGIIVDTIAHKYENQD